MIDVRWGSATHPGRVRPHNEDALLAGPTVFAVADGMGGYAGGEVASAIAVSTLARLDDLHLVEDPETRIVDALAGINAAILQRAVDIDARGMGTTIAGFVRVRDQDVVVFNLGDTRVYRYRDGVLTQLTVDHSVVGELVRRGELTEEEARHDRRRNVVTRALGVEEAILPAVVRVRVEVDDCLLVASDGLYEEVSSTRLRRLLGAAGTVEHRATALCEAALDGGGRDNVSVVLVEVPGTVSGDDLVLDTAPRAGRSG